VPLAETVLIAEQVLTVVACCRPQGPRLLDLLVAAGGGVAGQPLPSSCAAPRGT